MSTPPTTVPVVARPSLEGLRASSRLTAGESVTVRAPASAANLGPGFDSIGMALGVWDEVSVEIAGVGVRVGHTGQGAGAVPLDGRHLAYRSMVSAWEALGLVPPGGVSIAYRCAVPHSRGMGSSATAIVAGVAAATALAGHDLADEATRRFVSDVASGLEGHPDNASASVYGNATVSWAQDGEAADWRTAVLRVHRDVVPMVVVPPQELSTATARAVLPDVVPLSVAARNSGRAALLTHALTSDPSCLMAATRDYLHQEARRPAYPASMALVDTLRDAGVPAVVSGAGPTVLAFASVTTRDVVEEIAAPGKVLTPGVPSTGVHAVSR